MTVLNLAIVGAGLSGLSCAKRLCQQGHRVTIFERANRRSGRLSNKVLSKVSVDNGAQYFTARSSEFRLQCEHWSAVGVIAPWDMIPHRIKDGKFMLSPDETLRMVGVPSMGSLCEDLAQGQDIKYDYNVGRITQSAGKWTIHSDTDVESGPFDGVVMSLPSENCHKVLTNSSLPLLNSSSDVHNPCWSVILEYDTQLAPNFYGAFCDDEMLRWVSYDTSKPGRDKSTHMYVAHLNNKWTEQHIDLDRHDVIAMVESRLSELFETTQSARRGKAHLWRYAIPKETFKPASCYIDHDKKIAVTGDWTKQGRVENAFLSGLDSANEIDRHWRNG